MVKLNVGLMWLFSCSFWLNWWLKMWFVCKVGENGDLFVEE